MFLDMNTVSLVFSQSQNPRNQAIAIISFPICVTHNTSYKIGIKNSIPRKADDEEARELTTIVIHFLFSNFKIEYFVETSIIA